MKGSHVGFIEVIDVNIAMLRRRIKDNNLKFKTFELGNSTKKTVVIAYIEGKANSDLFDELYKKITSINIDGLTTIGNIEQIITDFKYSFFPLYLATERPDKAESLLLEGRFVIMLEGTPVVLIAPINFFSFFKQQMIIVLIGW